MGKKRSDTQLIEIIRKSFAQHRAAKVRGTFAWRCHRPGDSHYHFYVSWAPGMLTIGGDITELVVRHYSFSDPWDAAAWVNGASWDYFMEKACVEKKYAAVATAENIIEHAYQHARDWRGTSREFDEFKRIVEKYTWVSDGDPKKAEDRKEACREMLNYAEAGEFEPGTAYELTDDFEICVYRYEEQWRWQYEGMKIWAKSMWETEPLWHKGVRQWRRWKAFQRRLKDLKRTLRWHPIRYAEFRGPNTYGKASTTSQLYHIFRVSRDGGSFIPIQPLKLFGRSWEQLGLWETTYNSQRDDIVTSTAWGRPHSFRDIRPGDELVSEDAARAGRA